VRMLDKLLRLGAILGHKLNVYGWWHQWRRSRDRARYARLPVLPTVRDIEAVGRDKDREVWTRDRPRVLWDLISPPARWWTRFIQVHPGWRPPSGHALLRSDEDTDTVNADNDCDEAATCMIALLRLLKMSGQPGARMLGSHRPVLLQVVWRASDGEMKGHHVCAYPKRSREDGPVAWWHCGNWGTYGPVEVEHPGDPIGSGALRRLSQLVADVENGGTIIHAHACMKPETLSRWVLVA